MERKILKVLKEWKKEAGVKYPCLFKYIGSENKIIIYTSRPGFFIGYHGELVDKYKKKINDILRMKKEEITINFVETASYTI